MTTTQLFFDEVMRPLLEAQFDWVEVVQYAQKPPTWRGSYIRSIRSMQDASYIYVADQNASTACVTAKKTEVRDEVSDVEDDRLMVVVLEIEGWYLAGLDGEHSARLEIAEYANTDKITKERFDGLQPTRFESKLDFVLEVLDCFSVETARAKNASFDYFCRKFLPAEAR